MEGTGRGRQGGQGLRLLVNPFRNQDAQTLPLDPAVIAYHRSLAGYAPTPLLTLPGLADELGIAAVYLKDESHRFGLGAFKSLGGSWALHRLLESGETPEVVSTASAGNHGRGLAWAARRHGLKAVVFVPESTTAARVALIREEGAEVVIVAGTYDDAVARCAEVSRQEGWQVISDVGYEGYGIIPRWVGAGYGTIIEEVRTQLAAQDFPPPNLVVVQGGVGCLAGAVLSHAGVLATRLGSVVVEPVEADCLLSSAATPDGSVAPSAGSQVTTMAGLNCRLPSTTAWPAIRERADVFLTVTDDEVQDMMDRLAAPQGDPAVVSGASGAAGVAGLAALCLDPEIRTGREVVGLNAETRALVFNTEGRIGALAQAASSFLDASQSTRLRH
jgi:diaminopropionate ammonia-lyase